MLVRSTRFYKQVDLSSRQIFRDVVSVNDIIVLAHRLRAVTCMFATIIPEMKKEEKVNEDIPLPVIMITYSTSLTGVQRKISSMMAAIRRVVVISDSSAACDPMDSNLVNGTSRQATSAWARWHRCRETLDTYSCSRIFNILYAWLERPLLSKYGLFSSSTKISVSSTLLLLLLFPGKHHSSSRYFCLDGTLTVWRWPRLKQQGNLDSNHGNGNFAPARQGVFRSYFLISMVLLCRIDSGS